MLNAQRGREAVTQIARAAQGAGDVAIAPAQNSATQAPAAGIAEPRVVVEPAAPAIQFAPARPATQAGAANEAVRQAGAREAFRNIIAASTAAQPMGAPARPRTVIDQRI